jgi:hypothetical protein
MKGCSILLIVLAVVFAARNCLAGEFTIITDGGIPESAQKVMQKAIPQVEAILAENFVGASLQSPADVSLFESTKFIPVLIYIKKHPGPGDIPDFSSSPFDFY